MRAREAKSKAVGEMACTNEEESYDGEAKKRELLPTGDKAKEIVEVLAEMYQATHNPEDTAHDDANDEHASQ